MKGCGPSCRHTRNESAVFKIFVLHPKKTFATISARSGLRTAGSAPVSRSSDEHSSAWQNNPDFGELPRLRIDFNCARMLLDDDVVAERKAKAGTLSSRFGREERVEHLCFHVRRNADAVVADADFHMIAEVLS